MTKNIFSKSIPETFVYFLYILIAIAPLYSMLLFKVLGRGIEPAFILPSFLALVLVMYEKGLLKVPWYVGLYGAFTLYTILSDMFISNLEFNNEFLRKNLWLGGFFILLVIENVSLESNKYKVLLKISVMLILFAFVVQLLQQVISPSFMAKPHGGEELNVDPTEVRLTAFYSWGEAITFYGLSFYPVLAIVTDFQLLKGSKNAFALLFLGFISAILNKSRFVLLNWMLIVAIIPKRISLNLSKIIAAIVILVVMLASFVFIAPTIGFDTEKFVNERLLEKNKQSVEASSAGTRLLAFKLFNQLFPKNKIWGKGNVHNIRTKNQTESRDISLMRALHGRSSQLHVGYLSLFYYYGYVGGGLYMLFVFSLTYKLYKDAKKHNFWGCFIGWLMFIISNITLVYLGVFIMGVLMTLIFNKAIVNNLIGTNDNQSSYSIV